MLTQTSITHQSIFRQFLRAISELIPPFLPTKNIPLNTKNIFQKIAEYQFEQISYKEIKLNIVTKNKEKLSKQEEEICKSVLREVMEPEIKFDICYFDYIDRGYSGKLRFIISHIK